MTECFYCELDNYHPTCGRPGCDNQVHGTGPDGQRIKNYCEAHR